MRVDCPGDILGQSPGALTEMPGHKRRCSLGALLEPGIDLMASQPLKPPAHREQRWSVHLQRKFLDGVARKPVREDLAHHACDVVDVTAEKGWEVRKRPLAPSAVKPPYRDGLEPEAITVANICPFIASPALRFSSAATATRRGQQAL